MAQFVAGDKVQFEMPGPIMYTGTVVSNEDGWAIVSLDDQDNMHLPVIESRLSPQE